MACPRWYRRFARRCERARAAARRADRRNARSLKRRVEVLARDYGIRPAAARGWLRGAIRVPVHEVLPW